MKVLQNEPLAKYTTLKLGGTADALYIPETEDELIALVKEKKPRYFLGGGSNLLIPDRALDAVVYLKSFNTEIENRGDGVFEVGASVRLQKLINTINDAGFGGIEYLISVPGLVGGAVVMNAGLGHSRSDFISNYLESVRVLKDGEVLTFKKDECGFGYRTSAFKNTDCIALSASFRFPQMSREESERRKQERLAVAKAKQDLSKPNCGSVFRECSPKIIKIVQKIGLGGKVRFSKKTRNWILNCGGTSADAIKTIKKVERLHKLLGKKCSREVIVWE